MRPDLRTPRSAPDDPELDGIVRLATHICGAPAFVSLGPGAPSGQVITRSWSLRGVDGEIRGWLTVGGALLDGWQRDALDLVSAQAGALLERREREGELLDTIAELLRGNDDLLAHPRPDPHPGSAAVDVPALVTAVRAELTDEITAAAASVTYTGPGTLTTDAELLRRLVRNLVANALEHSHEGDAPVVRVRAGVGGAVASGTGWWIEVADDGPGIGPGIGPATCVRIAESLGGRITVDDVDGGGTVFRVTVPPA